MPDRIAERILRLIASREDASAIAGDLHELAVTRGKLWFWFAIARTVSSLLWKDLTSAPLFLAALGLRGLLVTVCLGTLISFVTLGLPFGLTVRAQPLLIRMTWFNPIAFTVTWLSTVVVVQFITGLYLANKSRGREIAAVVAYVGVYNAMRLGGILDETAIQSSKIAVTPWDVAHAVTVAFGDGYVDQLTIFLKFAPLFFAAILIRFRQRESLSSVVRL